MRIALYAFYKAMNSNQNFQKITTFLLWYTEFKLIVEQQQNPLKKVAINYKFLKALRSQHGKFPAQQWNHLIMQYAFRFKSLTCTLDSRRSSFRASASLVKTSGYCVFLKTLSNSPSCHASKLVRLLRFLGKIGISVEIASQWTNVKKWRHATYGNRSFAKAKEGSEACYRTKRARNNEKNLVIFAYQWPQWSQLRNPNSSLQHCHKSEENEINLHLIHCLSRPSIEH